jgi:16S rRNA (adenine(1408)-N(1))-methyltransferase
MAPAARQAARRRLANVLLVAARAEELPPELDGLADDVRVHFPWGSLLRGIVVADAGIAAGLARLTRPGGAVTAVLSVTGRERGLGLPALDGIAGSLAAGYAEHGLTLVEWRPASAPEIAGTRSSWAKRLGAGQRREAWLLRLVRAG